MRLPYKVTLSSLTNIYQCEKGKVRRGKEPFQGNKQFYVKRLLLDLIEFEDGMQAILMTPSRTI